MYIPMNGHRRMLRAQAAYKHSKNELSFINEWHWDSDNGLSVNPRNPTLRKIPMRRYFILKYADSKIVFDKQKLFM
jgi:hypothetical protein